MEAEAAPLQRGDLVLLLSWARHAGAACVDCSSEFGALPLRALRLIRLAREQGGRRRLRSAPLETSFASIDAICTACHRAALMARLDAG